MPSKSVLVCGGYPLTLSVNINDSMNVKEKGERRKEKEKEMGVFDGTTLVVEVVHRYGEVACRVDVEGVHGRVSKSKGAEEKAFHGEEYVPVGCS